MFYKTFKIRTNIGFNIAFKYYVYQTKLTKYKLFIIF